MKKYIFSIISVFIVFPVALYAQHVNISGAKVTITDNIMFDVHQMELSIEDFSGFAGEVYSNGSLRISNNLNINTVSNPFHPFAAQNGEVVFVGDGDTYINSSILLDFQKLNINKSSGDVYLNTPVNISDALILNNGIVFTDNINILSLGLYAYLVDTNGSNNSHVKGYMSKVADATDNSFVFPLGTGSLYRPIGFKNLDSPTTFTARHAENNPAAGWDTNPPVEGNEVNGSLIERISNVEYWELNKTGTPNADVILSWDEAYSQVDNYVYLLASVWNEGTLQWRNLGANSFDLSNKQFESFNQTDMFGVFTLASSLLPALMGDVNNDGYVNVLDVVWMVNYITGSPNPGFVFDNGDFDIDGNITTADLTALIDLIFAGSKVDKSSVNSEIAHLYLNQDGLVELESDGTLTAVKFQFIGEDFEKLEFESLVNSNHKVSYNSETGTGVIYSMNNTSFNDGRIELMKMSGINLNNIVWGEAEAANIAHELVEIVTHSDYDGTFVDDVITDQFDFVIYPNPSKGSFALKFNVSDTEVLMIEIVDESGRIVYKSDKTLYNAGIHDIKLQLASVLESGVHFIRVCKYEDLETKPTVKYEEKLIIIN
ncbi:MAG: dockerin type I domain-containing protein [Bacteroidota bacterium]